MSIYSPPSSDTERSTFLQLAATTGAKNLADGVPYLSQETIDRIEALLPEFEAAVRAVSQQLGARAREIRERNEALDRVKDHVRDLWEALKRRVHRLDQSVEVLAFYELALDGAVSYPTSMEGWLTLADRLIQGDARAVEAGYPAIVNPSADELQEVLTAAQETVEDVAVAEQAYEQDQKDLQALRAQAEVLIVDVMAELRYNLRHKNPGGRRRVLRTYGARFRNGLNGSNGRGEGVEGESDGLEEVESLDDVAPEVPEEPEVPAAIH